MSPIYPPPASAQTVPFGTHVDLSTTVEWPKNLNKDLCEEGSHERMKDVQRWGRKWTDNICTQGKEFHVASGWAEDRVGSGSDAKKPDRLSDFFHLESQQKNGIVVEVEGHANAKGLWGPGSFYEVFQNDHGDRRRLIQVQEQSDLSLVRTDGLALDAGGLPGAWIAPEKKFDKLADGINRLDVDIGRAMFLGPAVNIDFTGPSPDHPEVMPSVDVSLLPRANVKPVEFHSEQRLYKNDGSGDTFVRPAWLGNPDILGAIGWSGPKAAKFTAPASASAEQGPLPPKQATEPGRSSGGFMDTVRSWFR